MIRARNDLNAMLPAMHLKKHSRTGLLNIILARGLVLGDEVLRGIPGDEVGEFRQFLPEAVDRLLVHVGLGNELRQ